jgi:hypothetical protein
MMRKQLLLIALLINLAAFTVSQVDRSDAALPQVDRIKNSADSVIQAAQKAALSMTTRASFASNYSLNQPFNQISESTPTPTLTQQPEKKNIAPTRTPRPTTTPVPIPPAANPNATSLMILFGLIAVIVVIVGVWLNRSDK